MEQFGFLNVNKSKGLTSHDVIYILRKKLGIKQIGHSGTLDPLATGVLVVGIGKATRLFEFLKEEKSYIATMKFGYESETLDTEDELIKKSDFYPDEKELNNVIKGFLGEIEQIPPKYSAIKVKGKKLYELARKGQKIEEIPQRKININDIKLLDIDDNSAQIEVTCSKGTYIRSLIRDIAAKMGTTAVMTDLIRTKSGNFKIENSLELNENIEIEDIKNSIVNPIGILEYNSIELNENEFLKVKNGVNIDNCGYKNNEIVMTTYQGQLVSIGRVVGEKIIQIKVMA